MSLCDLNHYTLEFASIASRQVNKSLAGENCITHARALLNVFHDKVNHAEGLDDADVSYGVILEVNPVEVSGAKKRFLHAANYVLATQGGYDSIVIADAYQGQATISGVRHHPAGKASKLYEGDNIALYGQRRRGMTIWHTGTTSQLRTPPFIIDPAQEQAIVLRSCEGDLALRHLQLSKAGDATFDKTKVPKIKLHYEAKATSVRIHS